MSILKKEYWERRYRKGKDSGEGSGGETRAWKWNLILSVIPELNCVVDVGCGDLRFWEGMECDSYVGLDISPTIIMKNRQARPEWGFICGNAAIRYPLRGDIVFCMDMLFHIMDDKDFNKILVNLMNYSKKWLIIYTWDNNPLNSKDDGKYQAFRNIPLELFNDFDLIRHEMIPFDQYGAIYIFKKKDFGVNKIHSLKP